jgi:hypothetical protein
MILKIHRPSGRLIALPMSNSKHGRTGSGAPWDITRPEFYAFGHTLCGPFSRNPKTRAEALRRT